MPQPTWLPPLNAHNSYRIYVTANQYVRPPSSLPPPPPPAAAGHEFFIRVNTSVDFFPPADSRIERTIKGLSAWTSFHLPLANVAFDMIDLICSAPFPLDRIHWMSHRIDWEQHRCLIEDKYDLKETFSNFLRDLLTAPCNADQRVLAVTLLIEKVVRLSADEFALWDSCKKPGLRHFRVWGPQLKSLMLKLLADILLAIALAQEALDFIALLTLPELFSPIMLFFLEDKVDGSTPHKIVF
ncbi:hypothetical protein RHGRI_002131 [Rhododendron griersonianum]|uniref:Uncharacterized protein n=1 Tax=Rhododendron griersonianum TaxID=479676 RepID=A0AAV6LQV4_9ERIC|nr:hypothetical protein RHGRI_002131 [Rhododendron griersonianum]